MKLWKVLGNIQIKDWIRTVSDDYMDDYKEIKDKLLKEFKILEVDSGDEDVSEEVQERGNDCIVQESGNDCIVQESENDCIVQESGNDCIVLTDWLGLFC